MCRDYVTMRNVMSIVANKSKGELTFSDFLYTHQRNLVIAEIKRLQAEGLIDGNMSFDAESVCSDGCIRGLTSEGREFWNLIENDSVWKPILETLEKAKIDLSYPMLKDVCEEIVRRYVAKFIPDRP